MKPAFHIIATGLLGGAGLLSVLFLFLRIGAARRKKREVFEKFASFADLALLVCACVTAFLIAASILTGVFLWPFEAIISSPLLRNKITVIVMEVLLWGTFLYIRFRHGPQVWTCPILSTYASFLIVAGFIANMVASSIGGEVAGNRSGFENLVRLLGIETRFTFYLPIWLLIVLLFLAVLSIAVGLCFRRSQSSPSR